MPRNVAIQALSMHLLFTAFISSFTIASSSTPTYSEDAITAPARVYNAEEAKVTAAPELKRQDTTNYCTEWSIVNGDPLGCYAPNTCLYRSISTFGLAYCGVSGSSYQYATACSDYTALSVEPPYETLHCPSTFPYCHTAKLIADSSETYTMFGCDSWEGTTSIGYLVTGAAAITPQSSAPLESSGQTTLVSVALPVPSTTTVEYVPSSTSPQSTSPPASTVTSGVNTAAAIGGALGGLASVVLAILAVYKFWTKKNKEQPLNQ